MKNDKFDIYQCVQEFPKDCLLTLYRQEKQARMSKRLLSLYHLQSGKRLNEVIEITFASECSIRTWAKKYSETGFLGLLEEDGRGRYPILQSKDEPQAAIDTFKQDFPELVDEIKKENPKLKFEIWWQDEM